MIPDINLTQTVAARIRIDRRDKERVLHVLQDCGWRVVEIGPAPRFGGTFSETMLQIRADKGMDETQTVPRLKYELACALKK